MKLHLEVYQWNKIQNSMENSTINGNDFSCDCPRNAQLKERPITEVERAVFDTLGGFLCSATCQDSTVPGDEQTHQ